MLVLEHGVEALNRNKTVREIVQGAVAMGEEDVTGGAPLGPEEYLLLAQKGDILHSFRVFNVSSPLA
jgi:hypothetical protein